MKRLLFLTNIICFSFLLSSCQNTQKVNGETKDESKPKMVDSAQATDSAKQKMRSEKSGSVGENNGINKDSLKPSTNNTAIIHGAPDQAKIDSIKNAKLKEKK